MEKRFSLVFDEVMLKQLKKVGKNEQIRNILSKMLDKIELLGPFAGELIDSKLNIFEVKVKHPPIRLYYKHNVDTNEMYVFEFEMKTSELKQRKTISKIKKKVSES
jgi:hypothetical protein